MYNIRLSQMSAEIFLSQPNIHTSPHCPFVSAGFYSLRKNSANHQPEFFFSASRIYQKNSVEESSGGGTGTQSTTLAMFYELLEL